MALTAYRSYNPMKIKNWLLVLALLAFNLSLLEAAGNVADAAKTEKKTEGVLMKADFYKLDRDKADKGDFLGTAILTKDGLKAEVKDPQLEKLLKEPFETMVSEKQGNIISDSMVTYQPGTKEHLQAIVMECYRFGYIAQISDK